MTSLVILAIALGVLGLLYGAWRLGYRDGYRFAKTEAEIRREITYRPATATRVIQGGKYPDWWQG